MKEKFIKAFELKYPNRELGKVPTPGNIRINRFAHMSDLVDTCDDTLLASKI